MLVALKFKVYKGVFNMLNNYPSVFYISKYYSDPRTVIQNSILKSNNDLHSNEK